MKKGFLFVFFVGVGSGLVQAQTLIYRPLNPAFGGSYLNYSWLLNSAEAQNKIADPADALKDQEKELSAVEEFGASLQRQLLNRLSRQLLDNRFGEQGLQPGTFQFGDLQVDVTEGAEGLVIRIIDANGGESTVTVPYF